MNGLRVLVCGGRDFVDYDLMDRTLSAIWNPHVTVLIHGDTRGADKLAEEWMHRQFPVLDGEIERFPADWTAHGRAAGPIRNQRMLDEGNPDLVVAFPGGKGTADMVRRARKAGVEVIEVAA